MGFVDLAPIIDHAWTSGNLAWARNFRISGTSQTADVYWQEPLNELAANYGVMPDFSASELATLQRMGVTVPVETPIEDKPDR